MVKFKTWVALLISICGGWWSAMSGAISIPFAFLALFVGGSATTYFWVLAFAALWVVVIGIARKNHELKNLLENKPESNLEIEAIPCDIKSGQKTFCKIRVRNKSKNVTADNVQVELLALDDSLAGTEQGNYFRPVLPFILKPEITGANTINPESELTYNLFRVIMNEGASRNEPETEWVKHRNCVAYFSQESLKDVTTFYWKKSYQLKLKASARDLLKVETEFELVFSEKGTLCRFDLIKVKP
jgi:hypothetical protein